MMGTLRYACGIVERRMGDACSGTGKQARKKRKDKPVAYVRGQSSRFGGVTVNAG